MIADVLFGYSRHEFRGRQQTAQSQFKGRPESAHLVGWSPAGPLRYRRENGRIFAWPEELPGHLAFRLIKGDLEGVGIVTDPAHGSHQAQGTRIVVADPVAGLGQDLDTDAMESRGLGPEVFGPPDFVPADIFRAFIEETDLHLMGDVQDDLCEGQGRQGLTVHPNQGRDGLQSDFVVSAAAVVAVVSDSVGHPPPSAL